MSLPAHQQRVLDTIESALQRREPRLASMFTRLNTNEGAPARNA
jgi:predicted component of type VI protein secretion system